MIHLWLEQPWMISNFFPTSQNFARVRTSHEVAFQRETGTLTTRLPKQSLARITQCQTEPSKKRQLPWICSKGQGSLFSNRENFRQEGNLDLYDLNFYVDQLVWNDEPTSSHRDIQRIAAAWDTLTQSGPNKLSITETLRGKMQPYLDMQLKGQIKSVYPDAS